MNKIRNIGPWLSGLLSLAAIVMIALDRRRGVPRSDGGGY